MDELNILVSTLWKALGALGGEFWAAIAGAIVGGVISYHIQRRTLSDAREVRTLDKLERNKALAYSLMFKVISIVTNLTHIKAHIDQQLLIAVKAGGKRENNAAYITPIANLPSRIEFTPDEMAMLLSISDDVFNDVVSMPAIHNSMLSIWPVYAGLREKVTTLVDDLPEKVSVFHPETGRFSFEGKADYRLMIAKYETEQLADELVERSARDTKEAVDAFKALAGLFKDKFAMNLSFDIKKVPSKPEEALSGS